MRLRAMVKMHINKEGNHYFKGSKICISEHVRNYTHCFLTLSSLILPPQNKDTIHTILFYCIRRNESLSICLNPHCILTTMKEILELQRKLVFCIKGHKSMKADITA